VYAPRLPEPRSGEVSAAKVTMRYAHGAYRVLAVLVVGVITVATAALLAGIALISRKPRR
jgi:uncharacterized membrane protein